MKAQSAALQGALAVAGLIAAYVTWQRPKESSKADTVTMVDANKNSLEKVRFADGTRAVTLTRKDRMEVTLEFLPGKRPAFDAGIAQVQVDAGVDGGAVMANAPRMVEPPPDRTVYANERAENVWAKLSPLEATRALGKPPADKRDELGLVGSDRRLELTVSGQLRGFTISKPMKGLIGLYADDDTSHEVFLLPSSLFNDLDPNSQLLVERKLHAFKASEFDAVTITIDGKSQKLLQTNAELAEKAKFARAETPERADELAKNWHDKLWTRLIVTEVLGKDELPKAGAPKLAVRLDYTSAGKPKGWVELGIDPKDAVWARSENTLGWVGIHQGGEDLIIEAQKIVRP